MSKSSKTINEIASPATSLVATLDTIFRSVNRSDAPGLVVAVARRGEVIYRRGFGLASVEMGVANSATTRMRIGSTSKHFTCLAALLLAEEGKLDLDAGVRSYFPSFPLLQGEATLRQLLTHTSGYRCHLSTSFISNGLAITPEGTALQAMLRQREVNFSPGEKLIYNNGGYHLVSLLIERLSGVPFAHFMKKRIFEPIGMIDTDSVQSDFEVHPRVATLHIPLPDGAYRRGIFPTEHILGEGAMISTVDDMLRWMAHLRGNKRVGSEPSWTQLLAPTKLNNGLVSPYSLGLLRSDYRGLEIIHHPGGVIGGASQMLIVPSHDIDIVILTNSGGINPVQLTFDVLDTVLGDELGPVAVKATTEKFRSLVGRRYHSATSGYQFAFADMAGVLGVSVMNGAAVPAVADGDKLKLLPFEDGAGGPFEVVVPTPTEHAPATLQMSDAGHIEKCTLLPEAPPTLLSAGAGLVGHYRAGDLNAEAQIVVDADKLLLKIFGEFATNVMSLESFSQNVFGWRPEGLVSDQGVLTVEREGGRVKSFRMSNPHTRRILFERLGD